MNRRTNFTGLIENDLDFNFSADSYYINSVKEFENNLLKPYKDGKRIFYRGERKNSIQRLLLPSIYRQKSNLLNSSEKVALVTVNELYDYYKKNSEYFALYESIIGKVSKDSMYSFLAFSQHYFAISPLIDLTKNPYVALSFALKDRKIYDNDILIYTVEPLHKEDYTTSVDVANKWIKDYSVLLFNDVKLDSFELENPIDLLSNFRLIYQKTKGQNFIEITSPRAKLIDVPTNDLMRYQQGVFLLLDDFTLMGKGYLTKKIRDEFAIKKYIIKKGICPELLDILNQEYPYYAYENIMDLSKVVSKIKRAKS